MKRMFVFCVALLSFTFHSFVFADDSAFGGAGGAPFPIKQGGVEMVSEHVVLQGKGLDRGDLKGGWLVRCQFTFKNRLNKPLQFKMGFPFPVREEIGEIATPAGRQVRVGEPLVHYFSVWINGKRIKATHYRIKPNAKRGLNYKNAYLWDMRFAPNETVNIQHQYLTGVTEDAMGLTWAAYVLKTGGLWHGGRIGHAVIEVVPGVPTRTCQELKKPHMQYTPIISGLKIIGVKANRKYVWDLYNFKPKHDIDLCLQTGRSYVRHHIVYPILHSAEKLKKFNKEQLNILKNTIYAQYGRPFKNPKLQAFFNKQWWYVRNANYSDRMLNSDDKKAIAILLK